MKYDDASWHYGSEEFPADLPEESGATHIGMFLAWAVLNGLGDADFLADVDLDKLKSRTVTPGIWFLESCDGKFVDSELSEAGNSFADYYYMKPANFPRYIAQYRKTFSEIKDDYRIPDTWESYERLGPILSRQFANWTENGPEKIAWWKRIFG